jgi:2-oxoglutarate dehydrogenase E1 component
MYKAIKSHKTVLDMYEKLLTADSTISDDEIKDFKKSYRKQIENGESVTPNLAPRSNDDQWFDWEPFMNRKWYEEVTTSVPQKEIEKNALSIVKTPTDFSLQKKVQKIFDERVKMSQGDIKLNWGFAEMMAYSSLLKEGYPIRFTGQDVRRGTFDHRHAVIFDQENGEGFISLDPIAKEGKTLVDIYDSLLSEEAVLGFEYGYSATWPSGLVIWEAQFGDFANGAQVVIDQFIVSAEHKWERLSGLVMLLPHGFEGMGPEHSSARLERFLQLCAANNIQVCMPSSPSQIFHLLRRQAIRKMRRPLIVITPKSLLRLPEAASDLSELTNGCFNCIIGDDLPKEKIKRVVLCSGKVYYDLKKARDEKSISDVALLRLEQLYPFPYFEVEEMLKDYSHVEEFIWAQEEPRNQGAWFSHRHRLERVLNKLNIENSFKPISRPPAAAPAVGLMKLHLQQQQELVDNVLKRDNK